VLNCKNLTQQMHLFFSERRPKIHPI
jgi:hypothetical protein